MPRRKRSNLQHAHSLGNINTIWNADKENSPPPLSPASSAVDGTLLAIECELTHQTIRANKYEHDYRLERRKNKRSQVRNNKLRTNVAQAARNHLETQARLKESIAQEARLRMDKDALRKARERAPKQKSRAVDKEVKKSKTFHLKEKGTVPDRLRETVCDLVQLGVPVDHVESVISAVNESHGVSTKGNMSCRTASRIILEGGVTSKLQVVEETLVADGKSSGTTNKFYFTYLYIRFYSQR